MTDLQVCTSSVLVGFTTDRPPLVISGLVVQLIGVDEQQYAIWEEMELGQYSVLIHCRQ
jgi:hypothetical protein